MYLQQYSKKDKTLQEWEVGPTSPSQKKFIKTTIFTMYQPCKGSINAMDDSIIRRQQWLIMQQITRKDQLYIAAIQYIIIAINKKIKKITIPSYLQMEENFLSTQQVEWKNYTETVKCSTGSTISTGILIMQNRFCVVPK